MPDSGSKDKMRIMIAGGGTGGHVYPGIAIYDAMKRIEGEIDVLFIGAQGGVEEKIFSDLKLPCRLLPVRGLRVRSLASKFKASLLMAKAVVGAIREVKAFRPDVVIGTGGYACVAVIVAAIILKKPRILQEQNSIPGMATRILSRFSDLVLLSFPGSEAYLSPGTRKAVVGNPIRFKRPVSLDRRGAYEKLGLQSGIPTVLVMGGSRGARSINLSIAGAVKKVLEKATVQFVVLTGERDFEEIMQKLGSNEHVKLIPYTEEMEQVYSVADIAVSRSGASSVFELAAWGIPTIFIPYPYAVDDHQTRNIEPLIAANAAILLGDMEINVERLADTIISLINDGKRRCEMSNSMTNWVKTDADVIAAREIVGLIKKNLTGKSIMGEHHLVCCPRSYFTNVVLAAARDERRLPPPCSQSLSAAGAPHRRRPREKRRETSGTAP